MVEIVHFTLQNHIGGATQSGHCKLSSSPPKKNPQKNLTSFQLDTATCKRRASGWHHFDDDRVTTIDESDLNV